MLKAVITDLDRRKMEWIYSRYVTVKQENEKKILYLMSCLDLDAIDRFASVIREINPYLPDSLPDSLSNSSIKVN